MKNPTEAQLKKKLWKVFADYIKARDNYTCFTCGKRGKGWGMNAGHFIPKAAGGLALYFHEDNVHAQCPMCNCHLDGNQYIYGVKLGEEKVAELYKLKQQITKNYPYQTQIDYYKTKLNELQTKNI